VFFFFSFGDGTNPLVGRWENKGSFEGKPYTFLAIFRENGQADGFLNGKAFITSKYSLKGDTMGLVDATCGANYTGYYKCEFFGQDSLKFHVINDSCTVRVQGTADFNFVKLKKAVK